MHQRAVHLPSGQCPPSSLAEPASEFGADTGEHACSLFQHTGVFVPARRSNCCRVRTGLRPMPFLQMPFSQMPFSRIASPGQHLRDLSRATLSKLEGPQQAPPVTLTTMNIMSGEEQKIEGNLGHLVTPSTNNIIFRPHWLSSYWADPGQTPPMQRRGRKMPLRPARTIKNKGNRCYNCHCTWSTEWRRGPDGLHTLCDACGLQWAKRARARLATAPKQKATVHMVKTWKTLKQKACYTL
ncbi:hypothetical protein B0H63DRAFT_563709 [Podospora didyma]|uniref:GATA-type domain-containing protein n=1 Tax=Podospora didyma TaxID=330526 RepID=A0AAE0K8Z4_9PEZI|nr:hypothetical protein B0H63DRAFT_563709 [Podospora didyma]